MDCFLENVLGVFNSTRNMDLPMKIMLAVVKMVYICDGANIVHHDNDAVQKSIVIIKIIFSAM